MYTEEEAKTKWCHATIARTNVHVDDRLDSFQPRCIGSDCMAWRWQPNASVSQGINGTRPGYCGLAGKP